MGDSQRKLVEGLRSKRTVQHLAVYTIEAEPRQLIEANNRDSVWQARRFNFFATQDVSHLIHREWGPIPNINNGEPTGATGRRER
jgi:hypothetical protein